MSSLSSTDDEYYDVIDVIPEKCASDIILLKIS